MKTLNIINLHKAEIKKNQLAKIKGGIEIKCFCTISNPYVTTKQAAGSIHLCLCQGSIVEATVYNRPEK